MGNHKYLLCTKYHHVQSLWLSAEILWIEFYGSRAAFPFHLEDAQHKEWGPSSPQCQSDSLRDRFLLHWIWRYGIPANMYATSMYEFWKGMMHQDPRKKEIHRGLISNNPSSWWQSKCHARPNDIRFPLSLLVHCLNCMMCSFQEFSQH